jgi:hypothetical protein
VKLTARSVTSLSLDGAKDRAWFDDDISGFGIRLREGGSSTWIYRYRHGRQQRSITLGSTAAVPFALARKNAGELEAKVRLGGDPVADERAARKETENTFAAVIFAAIRRASSLVSNFTVELRDQRILFWINAPNAIQIYQKQKHVFPRRFYQWVRRSVRREPASTFCRPE